MSSNSRESSLATSFDSQAEKEDLSLSLVQIDSFRLCFMISSSGSSRHGYLTLIGFDLKRASTTEIKLKYEILDTLPLGDLTFWVDKVLSFQMSSHFVGIRP